MEWLYTPWRFSYVSTAAQQSDCIFCQAIEQADQPDSLVLYRAVKNFILLNRYPYNNGHLMVAPYQHVSNPIDVQAEVMEEMMHLVQDVIRALREVYHPEGFNLGMNLGRAAGAGVEEHIHMHIVPRWNGDTSFMTALAGTRVIPEAFDETIKKLKPYFTK
jgi:ATP adenylyltransferase